MPTGDEMISALQALGLEPSLPAPQRKEGTGPYRKLVIKNATVIDGTGAPAFGPADIVIENDRITTMPVFAFTDRLEQDSGDHEIDATGKYVLPGFIDAHVHVGMPFPPGAEQPSEYIFKLWMAHGVTTVREAGCLNGLGWTREHERRSAANEITAPRIHPYPLPWIMGYGFGPAAPDEVEVWLDEMVGTGVKGVKTFGGPPALCRALLSGAKERGLRSACHNTVLFAPRTPSLDLVKMGLTSLEHPLGLVESLIPDAGGVVPYPQDYNHNDEQARAYQDGVIWLRTDPGGPLWEEALNLMLEHDFTLVPTFTPWEHGRDIQRALWAEWHEKYTLPALWQFFMPLPGNHWAFYRDWTTTMEIEYAKGFRVWLRFVNDYKNRGGRVCAGSDVGFGLKLYGFEYIRELELLQEAGFHPLEVIRAATLKGAELLGVDDEFGSIEVGKKADLVIVDENPLSNLKTLYGTGHMRYNSATNTVDRVGGVLMVIKDGIVYDAKQLLADAADRVAREKETPG